MGTNNIPSATSNTVIPASEHNAIRSAMIDDHVPRNSSANAEDEAGSNGLSAFRWLLGYFKTVVVGSVADNITIAADSSDCVIKVGGTERLRIPQSANLLPPGMITPYSLAADTAGWLYCDGRAVSRTTYDILYTTIGDMYGQGNGSTTFNIPDFRGRFLRGRDNGAARDPNAGTRTAMNPGGNTGDAAGSIQTDEFKAHTHQITQGTGAGADVPYPKAQDLTNAVDAIAESTGGSETRPINAYVTYLIKT